MIQTADNVARRYEIGREEQDRFALESHSRALKARDAGVFAGQIIPAPFFCSPPGTPEMVQDETPRTETSMDKLAGLKPLLGGDSTITAGNSCPMNDGAAALLVTSRGEAEKKGIPWMVRLVDYAVSGLDPHYMGLGPVYAVQRLLNRTGLALKDVDIIELNEAFAAQSLACIRELGISPDQLNPHGGAIALGHPLGATGAILAVKLIHAMAASRARYGVVTMCIGGGQGVAALFESAGEGV
jgi:acetyl-CoA acetyltransferase family protein